ncbi:hypothetical protein KY349_02135 [Candidatus Woesearchaeota archaeon]|jgi:hypothetical protein|nr:hypothetical protein [Candidatus Woesearchaeota archaeon]
MIIDSLLELASIPVYIASETLNQIFTDKRWTSIDYLHRHAWQEGDEFTTENGWHVHKINHQKKLALPAGFNHHTHTLK